MENLNWIEIQAFMTRMEADIAKSFLESQGIATLVKADDAGGRSYLLAITGGAKLFVKQEDAEEAKMLLKDRPVLPD